MKGDKGAATALLWDGWLDDVAVTGRGAFETSSSSGKKSRLLAPQTGHRQLSGMRENGVPGGMPPSGSPLRGS